MCFPSVSRSVPGSYVEKVAATEVGVLLRSFPTSAPNPKICLRTDSVAVRKVFLKCKCVSFGLWKASLDRGLLQQATGGRRHSAQLLYKKSSSSAWCRDTRSPWVEIRQKGMLCYQKRQKRAQIRVRKREELSNERLWLRLDMVPLVTKDRGRPVTSHVCEWRDAT